MPNYKFSCAYQKQDCALPARPAPLAQDRPIGPIQVGSAEFNLAVLWLVGGGIDIASDVFPQEFDCRLILLTISRSLHAELFERFRVHQKQDLDSP